MDGIKQDEVDIYFFAVGSNPVDSSSVLAIFPLTQPPLACVAVAVSVDGLTFSHPVNLMSSPLGVRTTRMTGEGVFEWRAEDMPAAGILRAPQQPERILIYIHHAVKGTTIRKGAVPHLRVYNISADKLLQITRAGIRGLQRPALGVRISDR